MTIVAGNRYGRLVALRRGEKYRHWLFRCDCGVEKEVIGYHVEAGRIQSCGCLHKENLTKRNTSHKLSTHPDYGIWHGIKRRCYDPRVVNYKDYGGRGIEMCDRWRDSFANFLEDMGERPPGKSIDRKDVNGNYEPGNCRWATRREQALNTTRNVYVTYDGETKTISEWAEKLGVNSLILYKRKYRGWDDRKIIEGKRSAL